MSKQGDKNCVFKFFFLMPKVTSSDQKYRSKKENRKYYLNYYLTQ